MCIWHPEMRLLTTAVGGCWRRATRATRHMVREKGRRSMEWYAKNRFVGEFGGCWPTVAQNKMPRIAVYTVYSIIEWLGGILGGIYTLSTMFQHLSFEFSYLDKLTRRGYTEGYQGMYCSNGWWESLPIRKYSTVLYYTVLSSDLRGWTFDKLELSYSIGVIG